MIDKEPDLRQLSLAAQPGRRAALKAAIQERAAHELCRRRGVPSSDSDVPRGLRSRWGAWRGSLRYLMPAAAAVLLVLLSYPFRDLMWERSGVQPAREYSTGAGERIELSLEDGTLIILGASSRLAVPSGADRDRRAVHLEGIGYFDVVHDPARPFVVHSNGTLTRVLGTRFAVRAYPDEQEIGVAVAAGQVAVVADQSTEKPMVVLNGGQVGQLRTADGRFEVKQDEVELRRLLDWAKGPLHFHDRPLVEVLASLQRWHSVELKVSDSLLAQQPLSIRVHSERLDDLIEAIALAVDARYERIGNVITFHAR